MGRHRLRTPVVFMIFNRPRQTQRVFEAIREAGPRKLFVIADGPRPDRAGEADLCEAARRIVDQIGPDCEMIRDFSPVNLGCGRRISSGIDWVFDQVEEAIFLEDDCLPDPSFFHFCDDVLERFRADERIMMISGCNELIKWKPEVQSYHFARYGSIWGWATWKRAWRHYDYEMRSWTSPERKRRLAEVLGDREQFTHRSAINNQVIDGIVDTWDYQWTYARLIRDGLSVVPSSNLISNIGFESGATHTVDHFDTGANLPRFAMSFPLYGPAEVEIDQDYDRCWYGLRTGRPSAEVVIGQAERLLGARRYTRCLLFVMGSIDLARLEAHRAELLVLKARALLALGSSARALEAAREALALRSDYAAAAQFSDEIALRS